MASSQRPPSDSGAFDSDELPDQTYELTTPSQDGLRPSPAEGTTESPPATSQDSSQTFLSDEFDDEAKSLGETRAVDGDLPMPAEGGAPRSPSGAASDSSQTLLSDEFEGPAAADSQTLISDDFEEPGVADAPAEDSRTLISDELDEPASADSRTIQSDEFDAEGPVERTFAEAPEEQQTFVSDPEGPRWEDTGGRTVMADIDGTAEDSRTLQSDDLGESDAGAGLMAQSNIRQTINPKSMDSEDRRHWEEVIRGALGSQAAPSPRRKRESSYVSVGSNLNIQTRTLIEGQPAPGLPVDYRIEKKLGEGGMGAVYLANQTSLNRNVALKVIKPISNKESQRLQQSGRLETIRQHRQGQFLSEAVVTGDLEHPNIVPIYDVAATQDGTVFYAMKCVVGTPWSKVLKQKTLHENLEILLRVCDAVAFAHSRGVVHRDLKPENVMLGEFGVVLVMDWGLALTTPQFSKQASIRRATSLGGSPAYMAPELATGPIDRIGPAADIYLIGAMLYEVITGRPPHSGSNVSQCLRAAATNKIDPAKEQGELMDIALKAMATKPEDRYPTVQAFQEAVRGYLAHAESIGLAHKAQEDLERARRSQQYADYARAMFGFEQALELWEGNEPARQGLSAAQLAYAEHALHKADYELGLSLLDEHDPAHQPIVNRLRQAQREQESRKARLAWMKRIAIALVAVIIVGGSGALAVINQQKNEAIALRQEAETARDLAVQAEEEARQQRDAALLAKAAEERAKNEAIALRVEAERAAAAEREAKLVAVAAKEEAEMQRQKAEEARMKAEAAALAEMKAKEQEREAKEKAIAAQLAERMARQEAETQRKKAEEAALAEMKAKVEALAAKKRAEEAALAEMKAKEQEREAKERAIAAQLAEKMAKELETKAKEAAILARQQEEKARKEAEAARIAEEKAKLAALDAKEAETRAKEAAIAAEQRAQYEAYIAKIGLAKARIDQNEFDGARQLLLELKQDPATSKLCGWEWHRLMHQASQAASDVSADEPARDVSFSASGRCAVAAFEGGRIRWFDVAADGTLAPPEDRQLLLGADARTAALAPDERLLATGEADGLIRLWEADSGREVKRLTGHTAAVTKVRFLTPDRLLSASLDKTIRLWDAVNGRELAAAWHIAPVEDVAASAGPSPLVAAAVADSRSGRVAVWQVREQGGRTDLAPVGDFLAHAAPVYAVAITPDGRRLASGDGSGRILLWERAGVAPLDYGAAIDAALDRLRNNGAPAAWKPPAAQPPLASPAQTAFVSLEDAAAPNGAFRLMVTDAERAHAEAVRSLSFAHTGGRLVSAADDFTLKVWNPGQGQLVETLRGHGGWVRSVQFSPVDDDLLLSAGFDRSVKSWRVSQYAEAVEVDVSSANPAGSGAAAPEVQAHDDEVWSARFNRQGTHVVTTSRDRSARIWTILRQGDRMAMSAPLLLADQTSPQGPRSLVEGHRYLAMSIQATPDGGTLLIGGVDGTIRVFDVARGTERGQLTGCGLNTAFALSQDGRLLLSASSDSQASALLWEFGPRGEIPRQPRLKLAGHQHPVTAFAISGDGRRLFTGDQKGIGYLWDAETGRPLTQALSYHDGLRINAAAFLPDGRLLTASDDLSVTLYDPQAAQVVQKFQQPGFVSALSLSPDGRRFLAISERSDPDKGGTVMSLVLVQVADGAARTLLTSDADGPKTHIRSARFAPDGVRFVTLHGGYDAPESLLRLWRADSLGAVELLRTFRLPQRLAPADAALLLANQKHELVTLHGNSAFQWSLIDLEHHQSFRSHAAVTDAAFSADGRYVATSSETVKIWDAASGRALFHREAPHAGPVYGVDFTPVAGRYLLATAGADGLVRVWEWIPEPADVRLVETLGEPAPGRPLLDVRFSPDGSRLLAVGDDGQARVWELGRQQPLAELIDPQAANVDYLCGAFSEDGLTVVVGAADKRGRLWSLAPERLAAENNPPLALLEGHADRIESVVFLPAEEGGEGMAPPLRVLTASRDRSARLWDAATGREIISLRRHSLGLTAVDATLVRLAERPLDGGGDAAVQESPLAATGGTDPAAPAEGPPASRVAAILVLTAGLDGRLILWPAGP